MLISQNLMGVVDLEKKNVSSPFFSCAVQCFGLSANKSESFLTFFTEVTSVAKAIAFLDLISIIKFRLVTGGGGGEVEWNC